ncbi:DUF7310 family coiled-coil domain-containing protein [Halorussus sp. AFM4]|uniref:DUF7310 family coiled-coil domain-containing protein n=1 Tax=Halorussus sp. AFM4 TaxID=3421651 RepID=UPI003EB7BC87
MSDATDADTERLDRRLRAVERALTDDDRPLADLRDAAELARDLERLAERVDDAAERLDDLDAATQALRGYVGSVRAVDESVERRADAALATAEAVETRLAEVEARVNDGPRSTESTGTEPTPGVSDSGAVSGSDPDAEPTVRVRRRPPSDRPCGCESRESASRARPDTGVGADGAESDPEDAGLLARVAASLRGLT